MEQPPGHCANFVEELQGGDCLFAMHGTCDAEKPEVTVHFLCGSIGDTPLVEPVSSVSPVAFPEPVRPVMSRVGTTGLRGRLALDITGLTGYPIAP